MKGIILIFAFLGSIVGSYIPALWGGSLFSMSSLLLSGLGGFLGIWLGYKFAKNIGV